jgi:hypothetical protein
MTKLTTFRLPLEQHIRSKAHLDSQILRPLWVVLTQVLKEGIAHPPTDNDTLMQKSLVCCEMIITWDFGIEEGTFRRVNFCPTVTSKHGDEEEEEEDIQPLWPGSWGTVINSFVVDLMFKVPSLP